MKKLLGFFFISTFILLVVMVIRFDIKFDAPINFSTHKASTANGDEQAKIAGEDAIIPLPSSSIPKRAPAAAGAPGVSAKSIMGNLLSIENCFESKCNYPDHDPRLYALSVNQHLAKELIKLNDLLSQEPTASYDRFLPVIHHFILSDDGYVQEAALELLSHTAINEQSFALLHQAFDDSRDPHIAKQIAAEWLKYRSSAEDRLRIKETLLRSLVQGSIAVRSISADQLIHFVTPDDLEQIEAIQKRFPQGSPIFKSLGSVIERAHF